MQSYLTMGKGKAETVLFKMGLYACEYICSDSEILKSVILLDIPIIGICFIIIIGHLYYRYMLYVFI